MTDNILKIKIEKTLPSVSPEINVWNIFDSEHPPYMHGKRRTGEGMEASTILYENKEMNISLDTQKFPLFGFLKYRTVMCHVAFPDNSVTQYSSFFGVPTLQKYSAIKVDEKNTKFTIETFFYLTGLWRFLRRPIRFYVERWLSNTWEEDLEMKLRRDKFIKLGFRDMIGLPKNIDDRNSKNIQSFKLPLIRITNDGDSHPFSIRNQKKLFSDDF